MRWERHSNGHRFVSDDFNVFTERDVEGGSWEVVCLRDTYNHVIIIRGRSETEEKARTDGIDAGNRWYNEHDRLVSELNRALSCIAELKAKLAATSEREELLTRSVEAISLVCSSRKPFDIPGLHPVVSEVNTLFS